MEKFLKCQGCVLGPTLFNIFFHFLVRQAKLQNGFLLMTAKAKELPIPTNNKSFEIVHSEYADDLGLLGTDKDTLQENLRRLDDVGTPLGVKISTAKTKIMWLSQGKISDKETNKVIRLRDNVLEEVGSFCYLGQTITPTGAISPEIANRIKSARAKLSAIGPVLQSRKISQKSKISIVKQIVFPALLYASETWNTTSVDENRLSAFMNTCRLRILGRSRFDRMAEAQMADSVQLPQVRTLIAKRRLIFLCSLMSSKAPILARDMIAVDARKGKGIGGRKVQCWNNRILGDVEWLNNKQQSDKELLLRLISIGQTSRSSAQRKELIERLISIEEQQRAAPRLIKARIMTVKCSKCETNSLNRKN